MAKRMTGRMDGSFRDPALESEYREHELRSAMPVLQYMIPILGAVFAGFIVPDHMVLGDGPALAQAVVLRAGFLVVSLVTAFMLRRRKTRKARETMMTLFSAAAVTAFAAMLYLYRNENFYLQAMSVIIMIFAVFLLPNNLVTSFLFAILMGAAGIVSMKLREMPMTPQEAPSFYIYFMLATAMGTVTAWRTGGARRLEFLKAIELRRIARTDPLTGIPNRRAFEERFHREIAALGEPERKCALVLLDIDRFKDVNDNFGHEAGDRALRELAGCLAGMLEKGDYCARWGGEEFVILLSGVDIEEARQVANRVRLNFETRRIAGIGIITASFGVTALQPDDSMVVAIARADRGLYRAKNFGRNRVELET